MSRFLTDSKSLLVKYVPGEQPKRGEFIKLNTNESPFPLPKKAILGVADIAAEVNIYNDTGCTALTEAFAKYYDVGQENVIFSNGSDEVLAFCYLAFCNSKRDEFCGDKTIIYPEITYGFYRVFSQLFEVGAKEIPLKEDFSININDYIGANCTVLLANPNAPTGIALSCEEIEQIIIGNPNNIVIIDEAYAAFGATSVMQLTKKYKNLIVVGTFSKSRSMAGARLGYAVADAELIDDLNRIKFSFNPYNVNSMTQFLGRISIEDVDYYNDCITKIITEREKFTEKLNSLGFKTLPSKANFVFTKHPTISGEELYNRLREDKILVRRFDGTHIKDYLRISIGTASEMQLVVTSLEKIING